MTENAPGTKHERLESWLADFAQSQASDEALGEVALCLRGYAVCFNRAEYYEAHDILEHAWLRLPRGTPEWVFLKGMIQLAGGFVHLRLHYLEPSHRVHGRRLGPARKLFALAAGNLARHEILAEQRGVPLEALLGMIERFSPAGDVNLWDPKRRPIISLRTQT